MKTFKYLCMFLAALTLSFTTTSCSNDDDVEIIENGAQKTTIILKESKSKDKIVFTINTDNVSTQTYSAQLKDDKCTSCTYTIEFANEALADAYEKNNRNEMDIKRNGNTFSRDLSENYNGYSYNDVMSGFMIIKRSIEHPDLY